MQGRGYQKRGFTSGISELLERRLFALRESLIRPPSGDSPGTARAAAAICDATNLETRG